MKWIKFKYILLLIILMAMAFTMACGGTSSEGETKPKLYYTIEGEVKNPASVGVQNVRVEVADYTMIDSSASKPTSLFATLTDSDGAFTIEILAYDKVGKVTLKFSRDGFTNNYLDVGVIQGSTVTVSALIAKAGGFQVVDFGETEEDSITVTNGGASVTITRGTLVDAAGASVSAAQVSVAAIDSTANRSLLPGSLYGMDDSSVKLFSTFGMLEINVKDNTKGDPLYLASDATASISIPLGDIVGSNPSATIGLWYYSEEDAQWMLEGELTLNTAGTAYEGNITHFSLFNAGEAWDMSYIKIRVVDQAGDPVYGAEASFFTSLFSDNGVWQEDYTTGPEGYVPSILSSELAGIVPDDMAGYLPLPADAEVSVRVKYIKSSDKTEFKFPDNPEQYIFTVNGEPFIPDTPYTITTGAAGEITPFEDIAFELETSAFITATVKYESGDPATSTWLYFRNADNTETIKYTLVSDEGVAEEVYGFASTGESNIDLASETDMVLFVSTGPPASGVEYVSWFVDEGGTLENYDDYSGGPNIAKLYTTDIKGSTHNFEITLVGGGSGTIIATEDPKTYVSGIANLADGTPAPAGSWVVFKAMYQNNPVVFRAQVAADGSFPDPDGPFDFTTVGEGEDAEYYVEVIAGADYTVEILDVTTDPLNPDVLYTFDYEGGDEDTYNTVTMGPSTNVSGRVYYGGGIGADLLVTFTLEDAVTECVEDEDDPDYDEDCEVDEPVTDTTDATGAYSVDLEIDRDYIVTVSTQDDGTALDILGTVLYSSNEDAADDEFDITIGVPYEPVATVSGTVVYDGAYGDGLMVVFTKTIPIGEDLPVYAITGEEGEYSADLRPNTQYSVTIYEYDDETENPTTLLYPTVAYPVEESDECTACAECVADCDAVCAACDPGELLFTSSDIDSNITDDEDELDITIGEPMGGDTVYHIPAGSAGVKGTVEDADGDPAEGLYITFNGAFALIDDEGTFGKWAYATGRTEDYMPLDPDTEYAIEVLDYSSWPATTVATGFTYTSPAAGVLDTLKIILPEEGTTITDSAYAKGLVLNADGDPAEGLYITFNGAFALIDEEGTFGKWAYATGRTADYMPLDPDTEYAIEVLDYSSWPATTVATGFTYTSPAAGVLDTLKIILPEEGTTITDSAYARGLVSYDDGEPAEGLYVTFNGAFALIDEEGTFGQWAYATGRTADYMPLDPDTEYAIEVLDYSSWPPTTVLTGLTYTSPAAGVVESISIELPAP